MNLNLIKTNQIIPILSVHNLKKIIKITNSWMNGEYEEYSEEMRVLIKTLMKPHFERNVISYTFTNIIYIDEKINKANKYDINI